MSCLQPSHRAAKRRADLKKTEYIEGGLHEIISNAPPTFPPILITDDFTTTTTTSIHTPSFLPIPNYSQPIN